MTIKEIAIDTIQRLPENAAWEDILERINFVAGVRRGLGELDEGKGIPHEELKKEFNEWISYFALHYLPELQPKRIYPHGHPARP